MPRTVTHVTEVPVFCFGTMTTRLFPDLQAGNLEENCRPSTSVGTRYAQVFRATEIVCEVSLVT